MSLQEYPPQVGSPQKDSPQENFYQKCLATLPQSWPYWKKNASLQKEFPLKRAPFTPATLKQHSFEVLEFAHNILYKNIPYD